MRKKESMKKKKNKRRLKRIRGNNRKTVGAGWDTHKTARCGITREKRDGTRIHFPILDFLGFDKKELKKKVKRVGANRDEKR